MFFSLISFSKVYPFFYKCFCRVYIRLLSDVVLFFRCTCHLFIKNALIGMPLLLMYEKLALN